MSTPPDALRAKILATVAAAPARTRKHGRARAIAIYAVAAAVMVGAFQLFGGAEHAASRPGWVSLRIVVLTTIVALGATWAGWGRGGSMLGQRTWVRVVAALATPVATFASLVAWHGSYVEPYARLGLRCMGMTVGLASCLLVAITLVRRASVAARPLSFGAAVGAASGAWASSMVDAWCPLTNAGHVLLGHVLPIVFLIGLGMFIGFRFLSVGSARSSRASA